MVYRLWWAVLAHIVCDYAPQRLPVRILRSKHSVWYGLALHSIYAGVPCGLVIGITNGHMVASVVGSVLAHYIIDVAMPKRKTIIMSLFDQAVHIACIALLHTLEVC
jgi:hypothetical protein